MLRVSYPKVKPHLVPFPGIKSTPRASSAPPLPKPWSALSSYNPAPLLPPCHPFSTRFSAHLKTPSSQSRRRISNLSPSRSPAHAFSHSSGTPVSRGKNHREHVRFGEFPKQRTSRPCSDHTAGRRLKGPWPGKKGREGGPGRSCRRMFRMIDLMALLWCA